MYGDQDVRRVALIVSRVVPIGKFLHIYRRQKVIDVRQENFKYF